MSKTIRNAKTLQKKSRTHRVTHLFGNTYEVVSGTSGTIYTVVLRRDGGAICSCDWGVYRPYSQGHRSGCSHAQATFHFVEQQRGRAVSAWTDPDRARRQHRPTIDIGDNVLLTSRFVKEVN